MAGPSEISVRNEEDAWALLQQVMDGQFGDAVIIPRFENWPREEIIFWLDNEHEVLTVPMMEGLVAYQAGLYRSFLLIEEGTTNLRGLSEEQRREYEVRFQVGQGCTKLLPDLQGIAEKFAEAAAGNMTGQQITIVILVFVLSIASTAAWRSWLDYKAKNAASETNNRTVQDLLASQRFASEQDLEKTRLMTEAIEAAMGTRALLDNAEEGKAGILRAASRMDSTEVAGVAIQPNVARRMVRNVRTNPERGEEEGLYKVLRNDAGYGGEFRVKIENIDTEEKFFAGIRDALISGSDREIISEAEWTQTPFWARVALTRHRGEVTEATIVEVRRPH